MNAPLAQVLEARERRWSQLASYCKGLKRPVIVLTMNIPGPEKNNRVVTLAFDRIIQDLAAYTRGTLLLLERQCPSTGPYAFFIDREERDPLVLKKMMAQFDTRHPVGRWIDLDVRRADLSAVSRTELGFPERTCFICGRRAKECARSRRHSAEELARVTMEALSAYVGL